MEKLHILLVENCDNEIDFFSDALEESGLSFSCSIARNFEQAFNIFRNTLPNAIFINVNIMKPEQFTLIKNISAAQNVPTIFYSTVVHTGIQPCLQKINYVQLPGNITTMARILKNLFINNEVYNTQVAVS